MFKLGVQLVGGCCGTTPEHVEAHRRRRAHGRRRRRARRPPRATRRARSDALQAWSADPPRARRGAAPVPFARAQRARARRSRADVRRLGRGEPARRARPRRSRSPRRRCSRPAASTSSTSPTARARRRAWATSRWPCASSASVGIETILHVCGRDRNLLGDARAPARRARARRPQPRHHHRRSAEDGRLPRRDARSTTSTRSASSSSPRASTTASIPAASRSAAATRFVLATGAEPAALNYERELARLAQKKDAGAELVMTQPVYDPARARALPRRHRAARAAGARRPPAARELPQRRVPPQRGAGHAGARRACASACARRAAAPQARKEGVAIAREMLAAVRHRVAGAYVMPPLERYELALEVDRRLPRTSRADALRARARVSRCMALLVVCSRRCRSARRRQDGATRGAIREPRRPHAPLDGVPRCASRRERSRCPGDGASSSATRGRAGGVDRRRAPRRRSARGVALDVERRSTARFVDVGPALGRRPAAAAARRRRRRYVASSLVRATTARDASCARRSSRATAQSARRRSASCAVPQQPDESLAFDVACGARRTGRRRVGRGRADGERGDGVRRSSSVDKLSDAPRASCRRRTSDAEAPRLLALGPAATGSLWLARRAVPEDADAAAAPEGAGRGPRRTTWVEMRRARRRTGAARRRRLRRVTPDTGRVDRVRPRRTTTAPSVAAERRRRRARRALEAHARRDGRSAPTRRRDVGRWPETPTAPPVVARGSPTARPRGVAARSRRPHAPLSPTGQTAPLGAVPASADDRRGPEPGARRRPAPTLPSCFRQGALRLRALRERRRGELVRLVPCDAD